MSGNTLRTEDIIQAAMIGQRIEQIPKNFDYGPNTERTNQVISFRTVNGSSGEPLYDATSDDIMQVTGMRMTTNTQRTSGVPVFPGSSSNGGDPNDCYSNTQEQEPRQPYQTNIFKAAQSSALKMKNAPRGGSVERKNSLGGDSNQTPVAHAINLNPFNAMQSDVSVRKVGNASRQTQNSVVIVDQELCSDHHQE